MSSLGVQPNAIFQSVTRQADVLEGNLVGFIDLPVNGQWRVRFAFFVPALASVVSEAIFPLEGIDAVSPDDSVEVTINGVVKTLTAEISLRGHKKEVEMLIDGQRLLYVFKFKSSKGVVQLHPFVTAAEISLVRDRNPSPAGPGPIGTIVGGVIDAVDGKPIMPTRYAPLYISLVLGYAPQSISLVLG